MVAYLCFLAKCLQLVVVYHCPTLIHLASKLYFVLLFPLCFSNIFYFGIGIFSQSLKLSTFCNEHNQSVRPHLL
jgi:hypothetical protein